MKRDFPPQTFAARVASGEYKKNCVCEIKLDSQAAAAVTAPSHQVRLGATAGGGGFQWGLSHVVSVTAGRRANAAVV